MDIKPACRPMSPPLAVLLGVISLFFVGCGPIQLMEPADNQTAQPVPGPGQITVILANETDLPVDPNLYISAQTVPAEDLFVPANMYADFAGSDLVIAGGESDYITLDCGLIATVGSQQAKFGSLADWQAGQSSDTPVIHISQDTAEEPHCGQIIIFRFSRDADGKYQTEVEFVDPEQLL